MSETLAPTRNGIVPDFDNELYHNAEGLSKSDLDLLHRSAAHYHSAKTTKTPPTDAMIFGTAFHALLLEPERFAKEYVKAPTLSKRTIDGKKAWAAIEEASQTALAGADYSAMIQMRENVLANQIARELIEGSQHEQSAWAEMEGVLCKCRPDIWHPEFAVMADIKTTTDASPAEFAKACANFRYHVQDAWYRQVWEHAGGARPEGFIFIAVEKAPPYNVGIYTLGLDAKAQGWAEALSDIRVYVNAKAEKKWSGYSSKIEEIELPKWAQISL